MKPVAQKTIDMLAAGYQRNPRSMLVVDIDPPFVGTDFNQVGSDPSLNIYNDVLYLTFIDGDFIKVAIVDQESYKVTGLLRTISAPGASRPRLTFEPSTYPGLPDLPHIAYTVAANGRVMAYREQYNEDIEIVSRYDEIGQGSSIEVVKVDNDIYHFYVGVDGFLYSRKQGEFASVVITPVDGLITGVRALSMPDGRICLLYSVALSNGKSEMRAGYTELMLPINVTSEIFLSGALQEIRIKQGTFYLENAIEITGAISNIQFMQTAYYASGNCEISAELTTLALTAPYKTTENVELIGLLQSLSFELPHFQLGLIEMTGSIQQILLV